MNAETIARYDTHRRVHEKPFRAACYAGHTSMVFDSIGRVRICCANTEFILGDIRQERLDDIWSGARLRRIRESLQRYDLSLGCGICAHKIDAGVMEGSSLRTSQLIAQKFEDFAVEPDAPFWPKHLEFHLSNRCNLQCVSCSGEFSSTIRAKREGLPPHPAAYTDQFFEDLRKYLPRLQAAQFLGGEPFLIPEMYRVWEMLIEMQLSPDCHVTTNGTVFSGRVEQILHRLPMSVSVSMDGVTAETFEAIRVNARFTRVLENFRRFKEICRASNRYIGINFTLSRMNWQEFVDFLLFAESEDVDVSVSEVHMPEHLSLFSLSIAELEPILSTLQAQRDRASRLLPRNLQVLDNRLRELQHHLSTLRSRPSDDAAGRASLVRAFRGSPTPALSDVAREERARSMILEWGRSADIMELNVDRHDVILGALVGATSSLPWAQTFVGRPLVVWYEALTSSLGTVMRQIELDAEPGIEFRTVQFERPEGSTLLRAITVALHDADGTLVGAKVFLSTRPLASPMVSALRPNQHNRYRAQWEFATGRTVVTATPPTLQIARTNACNFKCVYCADHRVGNAVPRVSNEGETWQNLLELIPRSEQLSFHGISEFMIDPQFFDVVQRSADARARLFINTNGSVYTPKHTRCLVDYPSDLIINFSIDAATPETFSRIRGWQFERLLENIRGYRAAFEARSAFTWLSASFVITRSSIDEMPAFVRLAHELQLNQVKLLRLHEYGHMDWVVPTKTNEVFDYRSECAGQYTEAFNRNLDEACRLAEEFKLYIEAPARLPTNDVEAYQ